MNAINKENLRQLLEPHFRKDLKKEKYKVKSLAATELLTYTRFDIAFKLLYLEMLEYGVSFSKHIYKEHIRAFSLGKFIEPGNKEKNSIDGFVNSFKKTFEDIKLNGFDANKTLIPLSKNGSIANGAHRVASAIYLGKDVDCVEIDTGDHIYDYKFFYSRNISSSILDTVVTKFGDYSDNLHIAFLWPTAKGYDEEIEKIIPNIVYRKEIKLNPNGAHNLISQIYYGEEWLGSVEDDFRGSQGKLVECFKNSEPVRVIAFQAESLNEVLEIKDKVRDIFNVGKHSIHITDTKEEAVRVARVVFSDNSIHFLNYAKPNQYISTHRKIDIFKQFVEKNKINLNDVVLDSGIVLSIYGLRECSDIDYFVDDNDKLKYNDEELEYHDEELEYHDEEKIEMIFNPKYYFYFNDIKFISFNQVYRMKKNRAEEKDVNDCKIMEALIEDNTFKKVLNQWKQGFLYMKIKSRANIIKIMKSIGIYKIAKNIYKKNRSIKGVER